jgi:rRNA maturation protein Nop10
MFQQLYIQCYQSQAGHARCTLKKTALLLYYTVHEAHLAIMCMQSRDCSVYSIPQQCSHCTLLRVVVTKSAVPALKEDKYEQYRLCELERVIQAKQYIHLRIDIISDAVIE